MKRNLPFKSATTLACAVLLVVACTRIIRNHNTSDRTAYDPEQNLIFWGIALTSDGRKLYTANGISNDVTVIDTATNQVIGTIKAGNGPWGNCFVSNKRALRHSAYLCALCV